MAFKFTPEDFDRYVRQEEHGGRHIWNELQDELELAFGVPFRAWPYNARGDRIALLWFEPLITPQRDWRYQAMFRFERDIENRTLGFGLKVERPAQEYFTPGTKEYQDWDPDADWHRFEDRLKTDPKFRELLDKVLEMGAWKIYIRPWKTDIATNVVTSAANIEAAISNIPGEDGIDFIMDQEMSAEDAIALGEGIAAHIVDVFIEIEDIWLSMLPESVLTSILEAYKAMEASKGRETGAYARRVIEALLPGESERKACLNFLTDYIIAAHAYNPACWSITLTEDYVRLNIGMVEAYAISSRLVHLLGDATSLTATARRQLQEIGTYGKSPYTLVPDAFVFDCEDVNLTEAHKLLAENYRGYIPMAGKSARIARYRNSHSPGVLEYLRDELQREIPFPEYSLTRNTHSQARDQKERDPIKLLDMMSATVASRGLAYSDWQLATFLTALQTKGFVILSGPTGTGKSKLAQQIASLLPQAETTSVDANGDTIVLTVQPYMLKYNRIIIPKASVRYFDPPGEGQSKEITVRFDGKEQSCRFTHAKYPGTTYFQLLLRGSARKWFSDNFKENDRIRLQPQTDDEGGLTGINFITDHIENSVRNDTSRTVPNWLFVPVRPDWRDSKSLLGYYNPLSGDYVWTEFLRFVLRASEDYDSQEPTAWILILDEMNLARVEYYFADFLSILESGRDDDGRTRESLRFEYPEDASGELPPREFALPPNLYVIGTVNADETTHAFSPKVLDRAFTIELYDVRFDDYPPQNLSGANVTSTMRSDFLMKFALDGRFHRVDKGDIGAILRDNPQFRTHLTTLNEILRPHDFQFGYRTFDEIMAFVHTAAETGAFTKLGGLNGAFDAAVLMKVLPKFHGTRSRLEAPLLDVLAWCEEPGNPVLQHRQPQSYTNTGGYSAQPESTVPYQYAYSARRVKRMLRALHHSGFASFG